MNTEENTCRWSPDEEGTWHSSCQNAFQFNEQGPRENGFAYCPYCGKPLSQKEPGICDNPAQQLAQFVQKIEADAWFAAEHRSLDDDVTHYYGGRQDAANSILKEMKRLGLR